MCTGITFPSLIFKSKCSIWKPPPIWHLCAAYCTTCIALCYQKCVFRRVAYVRSTYSKEHARLFITPKFSSRLRTFSLFSSELCIRLLHLCTCASYTYLLLLLLIRTYVRNDKTLSLTCLFLHSYTQGQTYISKNLVSFLFLQKKKKKLEPMSQQWFQNILSVLLISPFLYVYVKRKTWHFPASGEGDTDQISGSLIEHKIKIKIK